MKTKIKFKRKHKTKRKQLHMVDMKNENKITPLMEINFEKELMNLLNGGELSF